MNVRDLNKGWFLRDRNTKPKLLVVCAQSPSAAALQAGHALAYKFIKELAVQYAVDVILVINDHEEVSDSLQVDLGVNDLIVYKISKLKKLWSVFRYMFSVPPRFATRLADAPLKEVARRLSEGGYARVYYEFSQAGAYHLLLKPQVEGIISCHDIQTQVALRSGGIDALMASYVFRYERRMLSCMSEVRVLSEKDKQLASVLFAIKNVYVSAVPVTNYLELLDSKACTEREPFSMVFWGAMNRKENEEAVLYFIKNVMPSVVEKYPKCKLYVVGNAPSKKILSYKSENIVIVGFVENPAEYFLRASLGVVPLIRGAGIKFKTLEMLVAGMRVISTPIGAEGVEENSRLKVVELESFKNSVLKEFENDSA